jgi:hypothetical protein
MSKLFSEKKSLSQIFEFIAFILAILEVVLISVLFLSSSFMLMTNSFQLLFFARLMVAGLILIVISLFLSTLFEDKERVEVVTKEEIIRGFNRVV